MTALVAKVRTIARRDLLATPSASDTPITGAGFSLLYIAGLTRVV